MTEDDPSNDESAAGGPDGDGSAGSETADEIVESLSSVDHGRTDAAVDDVAVYAGSDGRFYSGWQLGRRLASGEWRPCIRDRAVDRRLVEAAAGGLLMLERTSIDALPAWAEVRSDGSAVRIVDTRRALPPG